MWAALLLPALVPTAHAQVNLTIGNLVPGDSVTISYEVTINSPLTVAVTQISHQATVSGGNFASVNTDDPETGTASDATLTPLSQDFDFGDAPDPFVATAGQYPTLLANNGARHFIPAGGATLYLGAVPPDAESDSQPNGTATGDDLSASDDEDGVTLPSSLLSGQNYTLTVVVTGGGMLNAWVDWNANGNWNDPGDQIVTNLALAAGSHPLNLVAPAFPSATTSFARFRFSTQSGLTPTGQAPDGEVEDYTVNLTVNSPPVVAKDPLTVTVGESATALNTGTFSDLKGNATVTLSSSVGTLTPNIAAGTWSWSFPTTDGPDQSQTVILTANDGVNPDVTASFTLTVTNLPPIATPQTGTTPEDTPLVITLAATDPGADALTFSIVSPPAPAQGALGAVSGNQVTFTPALNFNGSSSFTFKATDSDSADSDPATVTITVTAVNNAPSFTKGPDQTVLENAGPQTVNPWATGISPGPPDESWQTVTFQVTGNTNPGLFSAGPSIAANGTLAFTPAANTIGTATLTVSLMDDGGIANGGVSTSAPQTFTVTVMPPPIGIASDSLPPAGQYVSRLGVHTTYPTPTPTVLQNICHADLPPVGPPPT